LNPEFISMSQKGNQNSFLAHSNLSQWVLFEDQPAGVMLVAILPMGVI